MAIANIYPPVQTTFMHGEEFKPLNLSWLSWFNRLAELVGAGTTNAKSVAKAWIRFTDTAILDSYNVTSVTDNGVGDFTFTFTTAFANANYAICAMAGTSTTAAQQALAVTTGATPLVGSCRVIYGTVDGAGALVPADKIVMTAVFFGDLA